MIGIEKNNLNGKKILSKLSQGKFPFKSNDKYLIKYAKNLVKRKVFWEQLLENIFNSKVVICSINFDIKKKGRNSFLMKRLFKYFKYSEKFKS